MRWSIVLCAAACGAPPPALPRVDSLAGTVDEFLTRQSGFGWSGNVLLRERGTTLLAKGYGEAAPQVAYSAATAFDIGSFAKSFTAAAIVRLEELGKLDVRDSLAKYLPATPADKRAITIHQLLTHTSGVAADFPFTDPEVPYEEVSRDEAVRRIFAAPVEFPAGSRGRYSNAGYILLAAVVEQVAGKPFRAFVRDEIFARAGLRDTYFWGDPALARMPVAVGHDGYGTVVQDPRILSATTWADLGGGQIVSTLADLERWPEALARGRVIRGFARVWSPQTAKPLMRDGYYGYGWLIHTTPRGTTLIEHGGDVIGAGCQLSWYREDELLLITSTNVRHDVYPTRNGIDRPLRELLFGGEVSWPPPWRSEATDDALGDYKLPTGGTLTIHRRGRRAFIGATGQDAVDLLAQGSDAVRARRAELTRTATAIFEGLVRGDLEPLRRAAGEGNPQFPEEVAREVETLAGAKLTSFTVLGTFATGLPHGEPPGAETTLVRLNTTTMYVIRWWGDGSAIAATQAGHLELAADTELRAAGPTALVAWDPVHKLTVRIARAGRGLTLGGVTATR